MALNLNQIYTWPLSVRLLLMMGVAVLVFILLYFFDISSLTQKLHQAQQRELEIKDQLTGTIQNQTHQKRQLIQYKEVDTLLKTWQKKLITYDDLPEIMDKILKMGSSNHIDIVLFSPAAGIKDKTSPYYKVPIKIVALGSYDGLSHWASEIAALSSVVVIGNFSITNEIKPEILNANLANRAKSDKLLMLEMTLEVYYLEKTKQK